MTTPTTPASNGSSTSSDLLEVDAWAPFLPEAGPALLAGLREVDRRIADLTRSLALAQEQRIEALRTIESDIARQWSSDDIEHARKAARLARDGLVDCLACESAPASEDCPACGRHPNDPSDESVRRRTFHVSVSIYPCITTHLEPAATTTDEASDLAVDEILSDPRYTVLDFNGNAVSLQADDICINEAWDPTPDANGSLTSLNASDAGLLNAESHAGAIGRLKHRRAVLWAQLEQQGGRGVELADEIDDIDREIADYERGLLEPFCACGRRSSDCDRSRRGCRPPQR